MAERPIIDCPGSSFSIYGNYPARGSRSAASATEFATLQSSRATYHTTVRAFRASVNQIWKRSMGSGSGACRRRPGFSRSGNGASSEGGARDPLRVIGHTSGQTPDIRSGTLVGWRRDVVVRHWTPSEMNGLPLWTVPVTTMALAGAVAWILIARWRGRKLAATLASRWGQRPRRGHPGSGLSGTQNHLAIGFELSYPLLVVLLRVAVVPIPVPAIVARQNGASIHGASRGRWPSTSWPVPCSGLEGSPNAIISSTGSTSATTRWKARSRCRTRPAYGTLWIRRPYSPRPEGVP